MARRRFSFPISCTKILPLVFSVISIPQLCAQGLNSEAELTRGIAAFHQARYGEAVIYLERAVSLEPRSASTHFYLAQAYDNLYSPGCDNGCTANDRRGERAIEEFKRAFQLDPSMAGALKAIAKRYDRMAKRDEAARYYRKALEIDPEDSESLKALSAIESSKQIGQTAQRRAGSPASHH